MSTAAPPPGPSRAEVSRALDMVGEDERRARIAWSRLVEAGRERVAAPLPATHRAIVEAGPVAAWHDLVAGTLRGAAGLRARVPEVDVAAELARLARVGARTVVPGDEEWPSLLVGPDAPLLLHVRGAGSLAGLTERAIAVVGSRASTGYGETVARELGAGLAARGWTVVSGGAYGIDGVAHEGALAVGGACVLVLPCGPDQVYPRGHQRLVAEVERSGLVVTEQPTGAVARRHRFLSRNRIIAGLAGATCVVEAGMRSGSLNTAAWAEQGFLRPVAAVPGPVTSMSSAGCHRLVRSRQAVLVTDVAELVDLASPLGELVEGVDPERVGARPVDDLGSVERRVHDALRVRRVRSVDEVAREAMLGTDEVLDHLAVLEIDRWAVREEGGWRRGPGAAEIDAR